MRIKLSVILFLALLVLVPSKVSAEVSTTANTAEGTMTTMEATAEPATNMDMKTTLPVKKAVIDRFPTTLTRELKDSKEAMKEKMQAERAEFKEKLATIKDQRKQNAAINLDGKINTYNSKMVTEMSKRLERIYTALTNVSAKETALKAEGKNTTTLLAEITAAQTAIDTAKQALVDQAAKDYVMTVTTDAALKTSASTTVKEFLADIKTVREKVVAAQTATQKAHKSASLLMGKKPGVTPTVTTTTTPAPTESATQ